MQVVTEGGRSKLSPQQTDTAGSYTIRAGLDSLATASAGPATNVLCRLSNSTTSLKPLRCVSLGPALASDIRDGRTAHQTLS